MANVGEDIAGRTNPEPVSLDRALWTAVPKPRFRESVTGIMGSVLAHLIVAGGLLAAAMLVPSREPPALTEIPVEIVAEPFALISAEAEALSQPGLKEPDALPPAASDSAAAEVPDDHAAASETEQARLPEIPQEPDTAALPEPIEDSVATISPGPGEQNGERRAEPMDAPTRPSVPATASPQPAVVTSTSRKRAKRSEPKQAVARAAASQKPTPARDGTRVARQSGEAPLRRSPAGRGARASSPGKDAVPEARGVMPRVARVTHASSEAEQGSRSEAAASPGAAASYRSQVIAHLTRFKRYPLGAETRGAQGTPVVSFALDGGGRVASVALARSSGHSDIDAETLAMVRRAVPFPAPPPGAPHAISAAISFQLR
jgi:periplasmic protein TonB